MVNSKYVLGFLILVLILGFITNVAAIQNTPTGVQSQVSNNSGEPRNFSITITDTPLNNTVKWYVDGVLNLTQTNKTSSNINITENAGLHNITVISTNSSNASDTDFTMWPWNVTDAATSETAPTITTPTANPLDTSANISFTVNQSNSVSKVKYGTNPSLTSGTDWSEWKNSSLSRKIILSDLTKNTTYFYSIYAYNESNQSLYTNSSIDNFTTLNPTTPNISTPTEDEPTTTSVNISFNVNQSDAKTNIKYGLNDSLLQSTDIGTSKKIQLSGLKEGTSYYYSVYAYNSTNQTFKSNSTTRIFTTKFPGPTISQDPSKSSTTTITVGESKVLTVTIGTQGGNLTWHENNATDPLRPKDYVASGAQ